VSFGLLFYVGVKLRCSWRGYWREFL